MMKNNIKALAAHFIIAVISEAFLLAYVVTGPGIGKYTTNLVVRVPLAIILIMAYVYIGMLLDTNKNKKYDFFAGSAITVIGFGLWAYTFFKTGKVLGNLPEELTGYWVPFNFYYTPFTMIYFLLDIRSKASLLGLFTNFLPPLLIGCGIKYKRLTVKRRCMTS